MAYGYNCILVIVDRFSKYAHFFPLKHPFSAAQVAQVLFDNIVNLHGLPKSMVSNRDKIFTSNLWVQLLSLVKIQLRMSTTYHPQTDGQSERVNKCLEMYLRCAVYVAPAKWKTLLPLAEFWYNTSHHSSLGCSPFKAIFGYDLVIGAAPTVSSEVEKSVADMLAERAAHTTMLKEQLAVAQNRMKIHADKK